ncbi:hypothetical protein ANANG_G00082420 [Anguilla anguilla]|uniref:Amyloid beta A4 precursor protein-binding family B member 1-interacting protein n=1 Tax=Anguilla anguilla TaxID=7936 RepID=A0A9D3S333_ANGAN|nr:hypothetical protein ANANG_G00082420 [Anguilla anguilla]
MDDIDAMFSDLLGEMDLLTQSLGVDTVPPESKSSSNKEISFSIGFTDMNESLNELEDNDLDALMADLVADISATEDRLKSAESSHLKPHLDPMGLPPPPPPSQNYSFPAPPSKDSSSRVPDPTPAAIPPAPPPQAPQAPAPPQASKPLLPEEVEAQAKADKIKLALEKLKEAKVKKLVVKVHMNDGSSKTLMVDERQTVRDVLDNLFEKTHCDGGVDWSLYETNPELQLERGFEDHENLVEPLSAWTRDSENQILFLERIDKYAVFKNPQNFYLWKKDKKALKDMKEKDKEMLLEENFCGSSIIVPDLEGPLYLKEDGKRSWKQRYFLLRASGIYYVPKGKSKTSRDLACFVQFDNVNVYYGKEYKHKYKAPTEFCFVLKHPQIQKESQYIKYLCCEDAWTMTLWVTGIRIAKYGMTLYNNYKESVKKAAVSSLWSNRTIGNSSMPPAASKATTSSQPNGHAPQPPAQSPAIATAFSEAWKCGDTKLHGNASSLPLPPPPEEDFLPPPPPDPGMPLPPHPQTPCSHPHLPAPCSHPHLPTSCCHPHLHPCLERKA